MLKLIVENNDSEAVEALKGQHEAVRDYLKGKENEEREVPQKDTAAKAEKKQRPLTKLKTTTDTSQASKTQLIRRVAELERKEKTTEKQFDQLKNKIEQSN
jgi:hypothetical protein